MSGPKRERDPVCDVCGHCHVQGVKCTICGHVGKYIVPGGPNRPNRGAIPPVPPGPVHSPNLTPPTIEGITVAEFQRVLTSFFELLPQAEQQGVQLPPPLANVDQLRVLLDALPDYFPDDEQPSYVLAVPCRPVLVALSQLIPNFPLSCTVDWVALQASLALDSAQPPPAGGANLTPTVLGSSPRRPPSTAAGPSCSSAAHFPAVF